MRQLSRRRAARCDAGSGRLYGDATVVDVLTPLGLLALRRGVLPELLLRRGRAGQRCQRRDREPRRPDLGDLLIAILIRSDYPWEEMPLDALTSADFPPSSLLTYQATFTNTGGGTPSNLAVTLAAGAHYEPGTSTLTILRSGNATTTPLDDPAVNGQQLRVGAAGI